MASTVIPTRNAAFLRRSGSSANERLTSSTTRATDRKNQAARAATGGSCASGATAIAKAGRYLNCQWPSSVR